MNPLYLCLAAMLYSSLSLSLSLKRPSCLSDFPRSCHLRGNESRKTERRRRYMASSQFRRRLMHLRMSLFPLFSKRGPSHECSLLSESMLAICVHVSQSSPLFHMNPLFPLLFFPFLSSSPLFRRDKSCPILLPSSICSYSVLLHHHL